VNLVFQSFFGELWAMLIGRSQEQARFHRGDTNSSGTSDISDAIAIFGHLFLGSPASLTCKESADVNNDATIDISDGVFLLSWLFTGGPDPSPPGPTGAPCGVDPDAPGSGGGGSGVRVVHGVPVVREGNQRGPQVLCPVRSRANIAQHRTWSTPRGAKRSPPRFESKEITGRSPQLC